MLVVCLLNVPEPADYLPITPLGPVTTAALLFDY